MSSSRNLKTKRARYEFFDGTVLIAALILSALGILMVFSITGMSIFNNPSGDPLNYMRHSVTGVLGGIVVMGVMALVPHKWFRGQLGLLILIGTVIVFLATIIFGHGTVASPDVQRWITIPGVITFQAVDLARIGFTLSVPWLIKYYIDKRLYFSNKIAGYYLVPLAFVLLCTLFVAAQPDLGSAVVIFTIGIFIFISSGLHKIQLAFLVTLAIIALIVFSTVGLYALNLWGYQLNRIVVWEDPFNHPYGLQTVTGFMSIALGGWSGVGIGRSTIALGFAIEPHTDLIITILSEELGFRAVLLVMILYFTIAIKCFLTALKSRNVYSSLVCIGIGSFFLAQPFVNLGGVSGFIPLSGVALPLISYGMTSKISTFVLIGIYFNMRRYILIEVERHKENQKQSSKKKGKSNVLQLVPK